MAATVRWRVLRVEANHFSYGPPERTFGGGFGGRFAKVARH
jgi:hypothetical protein